MSTDTSNSILFRLDASQNIGIGHAFRCMALIERLSLQHNICCVVIAQCLPDFIIDRLVELKSVVYLLPEAASPKSELSEIKKCILQYQANVLILDGYHFDAQYRQSLSSLNINVIAFDDTNDLPHLFCDVVINALPFADSLGYEKSAPQASHLLGLTFSIIRNEFLQQKIDNFEARQQILINFGGSDVANLTLPLVSTLLAEKVIEDPCNIIVVTGGAYVEHEKMRALANSSGFQHIHQCQNMAQILSQCKLAICAPGSIVYELAYCGVPSIFLTVADNQLLSAQAHQAFGWCKAENGLSEGAINKALLHLTQLWNDPVELKKMSEIAINLIDGKGVERICSYIKESKR